MSRAQFSVDDNPAAVLKHYWGYDTFRPVQLDIIRSVLSGHDTLGLMPTGGGKSITFQVPAMMLPGLTIVITPLISLMKDQVDNLLAHDIRAYCIYSGMPTRELNLIYDRCRLGKTKILYVSPERLQSQNFIAELRSWQISLIVVDEAHCISQWGYDFRPSYLKIAALRPLAPQAPVLALTASATPRVRDDITSRLLFHDHSNSFSLSFARDNLNYIVRITPDKEGKLIEVLQNTSGSAIVYVRSRQRCKSLAQLLCDNNIPADFYHAGLAPEDKTQRQDAWKSGACRVIVATNAFGMGIDKADVRVVVHYNPPPSIEEYYQEAGRAGRDGKDSFAVIIASDRDKASLKRTLTDAFPQKDYIRRVYELVGNFLNVAVDEGYDRVFEFDIDTFCATFKLEMKAVRAALAILTNARYLEFVDSAPSRSRAFIMARRDELYALDMPPAADAVLQAMLRRYSGLFADYVYISESALSLDTGLPADDVYQSLLTLTRLHVLHYVPRSAIPYIYYPTARELPKRLSFPTAVYEQRRNLMAERLAAVQNLIFDPEKCRQQSILAYFGEDNPRPCGKCDVCRKANSKARQNAVSQSDAPSEQYIENYIMLNASHPGGTSVRLLTEKNYVAPPETIREAIRTLRDQGLIHLSPTGRITLTPLSRPRE